MYQLYFFLIVVVHFTTPFYFGLGSEATTHRKRIIHSKPTCLLSNRKTFPRFPYWHSNIFALMERIKDRTSQ